MRPTVKPVADLDTDPVPHPPLSPALRAAQALIDNLGRFPAPPLPRDLYLLAQCLLHAREIRTQLDALDDPTSLPLFFTYGPLFMGLLATRPWGDVDLSELGLEDEDHEHYLIPLAIAVAEGWRLHKPKDRHRLKALAERRRHTRDEVKVEIVARAVLIVQNRREGEYTVRLDREWVKDARGKKRHDVKPTHDLFWPQYLRWWQAQVYAAAEDMLRDEMAPADTSRPAEGPVVGRESEPVGILAALDTDAALDEVAELAELQDASTPRQRELIEVTLQSLYQQAPDGTLADAKARAARKLGIDPKAISMAFSRIRKRASS